MNTTEFTPSKNMRGHWSAESDFDLTDRFMLRIATLKVSSGSLVTQATCHTIEHGMTTHRMFGDFSERMVVNTHAKCTEKNVRTQHAEVLAKLAEVRAKAMAFYKAKGEA